MTCFNSVHKTCLRSSKCFLVVMCFSTLTLLVGQQEGHQACKKIEWWDAGIVICLG